MNNMIPLYSSQQIRSADNFAIENLSIPSIVLMENAARSILESIKRRIELKGKIISVLCGKGNNGGDGLALAKFLLYEDAQVNVILLNRADNLSEDAKVNYKIFSSLLKYYPNSRIINYSGKKSFLKIKNSQIVIDAIFGTGISGELKEPYLSVINFANEIDCFKISIDVPSGLNPDTGFGKNAFKADLTISMAEFKKGLFINDGKYFSGTTEKGSIGIGDEYFKNLEVKEYLIEPEDALEGIPKRKINDNKYSSGKVLVISGSKDFTGAPVLTANSAIKSGAGAVVLACPKSIKSIMQKKLIEPTIIAYEDNRKGFFSNENIQEILEKIKWADSLVIGPGLGRETETLEAIRELIDLASGKKIIIDADAIYAFVGSQKIKSRNDLIFTPHLKEFADLLELPIDEIKKDLLTYGKSFSIKSKSYLVLKGAPTLIFNPRGEVFVNSTGNPGMAKFGVGDVLSGILGAFVSKSLYIEKSIISAVYLHSLSADLLKNKKHEITYSATEISENFSNAIKFLSDSIL
ncbi:MAG: bifunctional ADP-dependent NAD(P)H-hydrate dehydratase/NAD(P)H-hydrate epimerase [Ignavibacteriales bacterium]